MADNERIMVAGGGIGGLSAALACGRRGIEVVVFESAPKLHTVGTAVQLWLNGTAALRALGVVDEVQEHGAPHERMEMKSVRGEVLVEVPVGELARRNGLPPALIVRRPDLIQVLGDALPSDVVRFDSTVEAVEQDEDGITAHLSDGRRERGAALVAADGLTSTLRRAVAPTASPRYAGYQYLRALVANDGFLDEGLFRFTFGRGDRFGMNDAGRGEVYWFAVVVAPEGATDRPGGRKQEMLDRFRSFPPPIPSVIEATGDTEIFRTDICDIDPLDRWGEGRFTLLGDAAHATTPNMGRGASEAIEDAAVLGRCLASAGTLSDPGVAAAALRSYEEARMPATRKIQTGARRIGKMASWSDPVRCRVRETVMKRLAGPGMVKQMEAEAQEIAATAGAPPR
jgi:FAD-dependent urate hydroxylase